MYKNTKIMNVWIVILLIGDETIFKSENIPIKKTAHNVNLKG